MNDIYLGLVIVNGTLHIGCFLQSKETNWMIPQLKRLT